MPELNTCHRLCANCISRCIARLAFSSLRSQSIFLREVLRVSRPSTTVRSFVVLSHVVPSSLCREDALLKNPLMRSRNLPTQEISLFAAMRPCGFLPGLRPGLPFGLLGPSPA